MFMPSADISSNWGKPTLTMKQTYNVPISTTVDMCAERARGKLSHQNKKKETTTTSINIVIIILSHH